MQEANTEENEQQGNTPLEASTDGDGSSELSGKSAAHDMSNNSNGSAQLEKDEDGSKKQQLQQHQEDEDAALAQMMAFQEEQDGDNPAINEATGGEGGNNNIAENINLDPNVALLPGGNNDDDDANNNDQEEVPHPNLNNPAAIALRNRQALQNAARLNAQNAFQNQPYIVRKLYTILRPMLRYTPLSIMAAVLLVHHTLRTRQQFYLALVYLQSSKLAYILLGNSIIALGVSTFTLLTKIFLDGGLRPNERDSIGEHIRWDVTETCLALTIFRSELDVVTAIEFLGLVILKCLHWSVELRGNHLRMTEEVFVYPEEEDEDNPETVNIKPSPWYRRIPHLRMTHIRYYSLVEILLMLDILAVAHCALSVATNGPSVDILFGFEAAILLVSGLSSLGMYNLHVIDGIMGVFHHLAEGEHHHVPVGGMAEPNENETPQAEGDEGADEQPQQDSQTQQQEGEEGNNQQPVDTPPPTRANTLAKKLVERLANPWRDRRATLSFAIELQAQAAKFLFYVVFFAIVFTYYGMPINIFREVYVSFQQLRRRLIAFNTYRRLTHNMDKRFESIQDEEELDRLGHTCIICRDQMDLSGGCKKLPGCGHAFHTHCLREWLVQQQTCPTCRSDIAANEARIKKERQREARAAEVAEAAVERADGDQPIGVAAAGDNAATHHQADDSTTEGGATQEQQSTTDPNTGPWGPTIQSVEQPKLTTSPDSLPSGWTQHVDTRSGKPYYFNKDGKSQWDKPSTSVVPRCSSQFPCLYRVTLPTGAPIFPPNAIMAANQPPQRTIPCGKLVVCFAVEYWPLPFQEAILCTPDGFVRARDLERFLLLSSGREGVGAVTGRVEVAAK